MATVRITVKIFKGESFQIEAKPFDRIGEVKTKISDARPDLPADLQRLVCAGKFLPNSATLDSCGVLPEGFLVLFLPTPKLPDSVLASEASVTSAEAQAEVCSRGISAVQYKYTEDCSGTIVDVGPGGCFGPDGDRYEILKHVGGGATGQVYSCLRTRTAEQLAVKVVKLKTLHFAGDLDALKLRREVDIQSGLNHEAIVSLRHVHKTDDYCFLVMELVQGGELFDKIIAKRGLNEAEARYVFRQLLDAIGYMHSKKVIHRDLKAENVLVVRATPESDASGQRYQVKLADFGVSKVILTSFAKSFVGTPQYVAPEILVNRREIWQQYDQGVDFWGLGVLLYVMLCGGYPFGEETQIRAGKFNKNTPGWRKLSQDAKDLVTGLLQVDPKLRYDLDKCACHCWVTEVDAAANASGDTLPENAKPTIFGSEQPHHIPIVTR